MYKVIKFFTDLQDNNRSYNVGDSFPHEDCIYPVSERRITELAGESNLQKTPLIVAVNETEPEKPKAKRAKKSAQK